MAIKLKIRVSRKVIIIVSAATVLFGASGAAALFVGRDAILGPSKESISGVECKDVVRIADVRGREMPWLRKYIRVESADGETRLKTALRVAEFMREHLPAELIHVAVLNENGPDVRAQMRGRALGAEVFLVPDEHVQVPGIEGELKGYYYEGNAAADGIFYGDKHEVSEHELKDMASLMEEKEDCIPPEDKEAAAGETSGGGHGGAAPAEAEAASGHGGGEGEADAAGGHGGGDEAASADHGEAAAEPGFVGKMLSMVGLGGGDEPAAHGETPAGDHGAAADEGHGSADDGHGAADGEAHGETPDAHGGEPADAESSGGHGEEAAVKPAHGATTEEAVDAGSGEQHEAAVGHEPAAEQAVAEEDHAAGGEHGGDTHETPVEEPVAEAEAHSAGDAAHSAHEAPVAEEEADASADHAIPADESKDASNEAVKPSEDQMVEQTDTNDAGWDGGHDGEIVIHDGPSDALILGWSEEPDGSISDPASEATHKVDPEPVSSVNGGGHETTADH